jgi:hypothetical protein
VIIKVHTHRVLRVNSAAVYKVVGKMSCCLKYKYDDFFCCKAHYRVLIGFVYIVKMGLLELSDNKPDSFYETLLNSCCGMHGSLALRAALT